MMLQVGATSVIALAIFLETEAFFLPSSKHLDFYTDPRIDYGSDVRDLTFPGHIVYSIEQIPPNEPFLTDSDISNAIYQDMASKKQQGGIMLPMKRALNGLPEVSKRIHTCAFMRRLGLPIGLCFKGSRNRVIQQPRVQEDAETPEQDAYAYLERQWPVHSMLGGGVGK
ncbi:uncharacterized protein LOC128550177 [Mercenaria mercenaria]|uniref:uncharacterized protein LOC128550177 n=1 Tax=Mercenaria mercenaria TaxID=6596 RepID=UPI00234EFA57|nr:uncharacterized protein LOC128550177 [Mercenaria mercenaria]